MAETGIVQINASLNVLAAAAEDYSTLLIVDCNHTSFIRASVYASPDDYANTVLTGTPLRGALDSAFSASVRPAQVIAGRAKGSAILAPQSVADGVVYGATIIVAGGGNVNASYTAGAAETAEDVCTGLKADIDAVTEVTDEVTATVVGTGEDAVLQVSLNTSDDDFTLSNVSENIEVTSTASEAVSDTLQTIADANDQWTWITATDHTPAYQVSLMSQAEILQKPYVTSTQLPEAYAVWNGEDTPDSNDVGAVAKFNSRVYTHVMYHHQADTIYPENVRVTEFTWLTPGGSNFQYKPLSGVPLAQEVSGTIALNTTQLFNLETKSMSTTVELGGVTVVGSRIRDTGNRMSTGVRMEAVAVLIYTRQQVARITETIFLRKNKVALNDADIDLFKKKWTKFFTDNASGGGVTRAFEESRPVQITVPAAKDISFEDKVDGLLQNVNIIGYMDPSIDSTIINLSLTYSDPTEV